MMNEDDRLIRIIQSSTQGLLTSFKNKTQLLRECSNDIKQLIREGYDINAARKAAKKLFGKYDAPFLAIDGTQSQDQALDMLIFYAGAFGYLGNLDFTDKGCCYDEPSEIKGTMNISAAIPLHEEDAASVAGKKTEGGIEVDTGRLPSSLMHLAEYYMAVKTIYENPEIKVVLLDKTLSGDVAHLVWSVSEVLDTDSCILQGIKTEYGKVSNLDLQLARILHPNSLLQIPVARSHLIKYAAINKLIEESENGTVAEISYEDLLNKTGANKDRMNKLVNELTDLNKRYCFFDSKNNNDNHVHCTLNFRQDVKNYWNRVFHTSMKLSEHIFNTPEGKHPLIYENVQDGSKKTKNWITADDLDYLTLVMIYALLRLAWEKKVLVIGLIKDVAAAELMKSVVPILQSSGKIKLSSGFPTFNSDKMLLQTNSIINTQSTKAPWRTFEFDACFRTIAPLSDEEKDQEDSRIIKKSNRNETKVAGAFKNLISSERMFLKSYVQLWCSESDPTVRSHVFAYDRPCYPGFDKYGELLLDHKDGTVNEEIQPMIHFENDGEISHLVMDILCSMSSEIIPECLGHNYPLFLADKKAKSILEGSKSAYVSAVAYEIANSQFDQQILFESKFREFRAQVESRRRGA